MPILDCESPETTEESLTAILELNDGDLRNRIREIKPSDFEVNTSIVDDRWLPLLRTIAGSNVRDIREGHTCWFHATRVQDFLSFRQGIHPLPSNVNRVWDSLYCFVADCLTREDWKDFRQETEAENYGGHSREVIEAWMANKGPYAFLFAESTLNPEKTGNHDYFRTSELVEFITICFKRRFRVDLHERYSRVTRPGIIKFSTSGVKAAHLGAALDYLIHRAAGWSLMCLDPCFSADGAQILPSQVIKAIPIVEFTGKFRRTTSYGLSASIDHVPLSPGGGVKS